MATVIAVLAALGAAVCFAAGSVLQQGAARESTAGALRLRLLLDLVRSRRWIAGTALDVFSFAMQGLALAFGPLALVQPLAGTDVLFALPLIARRNQRRLTRRDVAGALAVTGGVATFLVVSPPTGGVGVPALAKWVPVLLAVAALVTVSGVVALRVTSRPQVIWLAAAAGIMFAVLDALLKSSVDLLATRGFGALLSWEPYAMAVVAAVGGLFGQSAFGAGSLALSLPVIDTLEPVAAVVIAAAVFGERLARSPVLLGFQLAGGVIAAAGIWLLSRSSIVEAETSPAPGAPSQAPTGPGPRSATGSANPGPRRHESRTDESGT